MITKPNYLKHSNTQSNLQRALWSYKPPVKKQFTSHILHFHLYPSVYTEITNNKF